MFSVSVRDHVMIAHSLRGELFGPAQQLHGATYVIDLELKRRTLDANGVVVDIGRAHSLLSSVLAPLKYKNLDEVPELAGLNTTTEVLAKWVFDQVVARLTELGPGGDVGLHAIRVVLRESHVAQAAYEAVLV
jgi:6-pyruvoyltetrahydropterin/6-carboxytetrahydropterin synthase